VGEIHYDPSKFPITPMDFFLPQLELLETSLTRDKEAGNRVLIAHYLCHTTKLCRRDFGLPRLACASEVDIPAEEIPDIGFLSGTLDFAIAKVKGHGRIGNPLWLLRLIGRGNDARSRRSQVIHVRCSLPRRR
jgi:hypothetical protein